ncbi:DUF6236 family protein [uncultured Algoriphagus sp.]|uniref:DUF6236 family protein n=1 Tax=uncultured Algoriphagus sp. TaxID=417365 RepID=UPI0030EB1DE9|tara:strand:- start:1066 stop:2142 length:1077 start_codon:yes stop_codon:yes gene_type:complete
MGFTKALYYPTIDILNEEWLKNAVLFWDEINTIVPDSIDNPYKNNSSQYLFDEGILKPFKVNPDQNIIKSLTDETLKYLHSNEASQLLIHGKGSYSMLHRNRVSSDVSMLFDIHYDKLPDEIKYLLEEDMNWGWYRVDSNFASFYLTLLANKICEQNSIALLTDNSLTSNLSDFVRLDNQIKKEEGFLGYRGYTKNQVANLAQGLLTNLIIKGVKISEVTSLTDVVNFKRRHQDELGLLRTNILKLTKDIPKDIPLEAFKQQIEDVYHDDFLPAYNNFKKSLDGSSIKWTVDNFMKISFFSTSATAIPMTLLGLSMPQALLAGAGVSIITSLVSYNVDKKEKLRNNPYSYLLAVEKGI